MEASYFNDIKSVDGRNIIQNPDNVMVMVNKQFSLPDGYEPSKLMIPDVAFSYGKLDLEKSYMRQDAAEELEKLFAGALNEGVELFAVSGYRSFTRQSEVFEAEVNRVGKEKAVQAVAIPGSSEHQTGLSMDISSRSASLELSEEFGRQRKESGLLKMRIIMVLFSAIQKEKKPSQVINMSLGISVMWAMKLRKSFMKRNGLWKSTLILLKSKRPKWPLYLPFSFSLLFPD